MAYSTRSREPGRVATFFANWSGVSICSRSEPSCTSPQVPRTLTLVRTRLSSPTPVARFCISPRPLCTSSSRSDTCLNDSLEQRLSESFKQVSDRLELVHKGLGEMQNLATGVGELKRVLTNVKVRGTWGEVQLGSLLEQMLTPDQFAKNVATRPGSRERVEYAIRLPGRDTQEQVWLPIDAKFPLEDYERLAAAQDRADPVAL